MDGHLETAQTYARQYLNFGKTYDLTKTQVATQLAIAVSLGNIAQSLQQIVELMANLVDTADNRM